MLFCQYDTNVNDVETVSKCIDYLKELLPNETVGAVPSGVSIADLSDEYGIETLKQIERFIHNTVSSIESTLKKEYSIEDAIKYMNIACNTSPYFEKAWDTICKHYGIEEDKK